MRPPICDKTAPPHLENPGSATVTRLPASLIAIIQTPLHIFYIFPQDDAWRIYNVFLIYDEIGLLYLYWIRQSPKIRSITYLSLCASTTELQEPNPSHIFEHLFLSDVFYIDILFRSLHIYLFII